MRADHSRAAWCFLHHQLVSISGSVRRVGVRWWIAKCRTENERRVLVKLLMDGGRWRLLFWLEKGSSSTFMGKYVTSASLHRRTGYRKMAPSLFRWELSLYWADHETRKCPSVATTAAWWIFASNRPINLAQKRKDMNVNGMWWIFFFFLNLNAHWNHLSTAESLSGSHLKSEL